MSFDARSSFHTLKTVEMVSKVYRRNNGVKLLSFALKPQNRMRNKKVSCYL